MMSAEQIHAAIEAALDEMTDGQRAVYVAVADGHTLSSAAAAFGIAKATAQCRYRGAKVKIADHLLPMLFEEVER